MTKKNRVRIYTSMPFDEPESGQVTEHLMVSYFERDFHCGVCDLVQVDFGGKIMIEEAGTYLEKNKSSSGHRQSQHGFSRGNSRPCRATGRALHRLRRRYHRFGTVLPGLRKAARPAR